MSSASTPVARRRESIRALAEAAEARAGHLDARERADPLLLVQDEVDSWSLTRAAGLAPGSLDDCSLSTDSLPAALATLRGRPTL